MVEHFIKIPQQIPKDILRKTHILLPEHLQKYFSAMPTARYDIDPEWNSISCYGAAFSMYTASLGGYLGIQNTILQHKKPEFIASTILNTCFNPTASPKAGDLSFFYQATYVHAGIYIGTKDGQTFILSKLSSGPMPLEIETSAELQKRFKAPKLRYWRLKQYFMLLERQNFNLINQEVDSPVE